VFAVVFGSALLAMFVHRALPEDHLSADSKDVVKLGIALIATMSALVLSQRGAASRGDVQPDRHRQVERRRSASLIGAFLCVFFSTTGSSLLAADLCVPIHSIEMPSNSTIRFMGHRLQEFSNSEHPQHSSYPNDRGAYNHKYTDGDQSISDNRPSLINLITPDGWQKISRYCENHADNHQNKWLQEKFICDVHVTDVGVAVFTGLLVIATASLFIIGLIQAGIMGRTARRQLRAYVFVDQATVIEPDGADPRLDIQIRNSGQTPAHEVVVAGIVRGFNPHDARLFSDPPKDSEFSRFVFGPNRFAYKSFALKELLNSNTMKGLRSRDQHILYVWGEISYRDVFKKSRYTKFRLSIGGPSGWPDTNLMIVSAEGNKAN
jgi:hypothetical protein